MCFDLKKHRAFNFKCWIFKYNKKDENMILDRKKKN